MSLLNVITMMVGKVNMWDLANVVHLKTLNIMLVETKEIGAIAMILTAVKVIIMRVSLER